LFNGKLVAVENVDAIHSKKIKHIKIIFKEMPDRKILEDMGCEILNVDGNEVSVKFKGDINNFLKTVSGLRIEDISIMPSNLEDFFLEFYFSEKIS
jgi:ABC-2 type transport system ATP-binding protein